MVSHNFHTIGVLVPVRRVSYVLGLRTVVFRYFGDPDAKQLCLVFELVLVVVATYPLRQLVVKLDVYRFRGVLYRLLSILRGVDEFFVKH